MPDYLLDAEDGLDPRKDETPAKYSAIFERRAMRGQCFHQPYLGCREFAAAFRLVEPQAEPAVAIAETRDLGWMLYDLDYSDPGDPKPIFFRAQLDNGAINTDRNQVEVRG